MGDHEGVEIRPGRRDVLEKARSLLDAALRQHHMGESVLRPGLLALELEGSPGRALRLARQMTFLVSKGGHAVRVCDVGVVLEHLERRAQHGRKVARD
jgi:hypothetical protein